MKIYFNINKDREISHYGESLKNLIMCFLVTMTISATANEENNSALEIWKKHRFMMSYGVSSHQGSVKLGTTNVAIEINTEDTLGLDSSQSTFRLGYQWRFSNNRRHSLDFNYHGFHRNASTQLLRDVTITKPDGTDVDLDKGQGIDTILNFDIYKLHYDYAFILDDRMNLSVGGGFYVMPFEIGIHKNSSSEGTESKFIAPLPTVKLGAEFIITEKWRLISRTDVLYLKYNNFTGHLITNSLVVEYLAYKGLSVGLGFENFGFGATLEKKGDLINSNFAGSVDINNKSLLVHLKYSL